MLARCGFPLLCRRAAGSRGPRAAVCATADASRINLWHHICGWWFNHYVRLWKTTVLLLLAFLWSICSHDPTIFRDGESLELL